MNGNKKSVGFGQFFKKRIRYSRELKDIQQKIFAETEKELEFEIEKNQFHLKFLDHISELAMLFGFRVTIMHHSRRDRNQWRSVSEDLVFSISDTKKMENLASKYNSYKIDEYTTLNLNGVANSKIKKGLLFQFFGAYDYLIATTKLNENVTGFFTFLESLVFIIKMQLDNKQKIQSLDNKVNLLKDELSLTDMRLQKTEKSLKKRAYEINNLLEISNELYSILNLEQLINSALLILVGQLGCLKTFALLHEPLHSTYSRHFTKGFGDEQEDVFEIAVDHPVIHYFTERRTPVMVDDLAKNKKLTQFAKKLIKNEVEVIAPIIYSERVKGILGCGSKLYGDEFDSSDVQILSILVNIISVSISNAEMYENLKHMSFTDAMTNLYNFRYFENRLKEEINRSKRTKSSVSLLMLDIDHFKNYNDTLGHQAGDEALRALGLILNNTVREDDIVCRYGGEEFAIIMPGTEPGDVNVLAERIRENVESYDFYKKEIQPDGNLTISSGAAAFPHYADDLEELTKNADNALYQSKNNGRNQFTLFQPEEAL